MMMMMIVIMMMINASNSHFWLKQTKKKINLGPKTSAQTHPSQYHSNRSACFLQSQTPSLPYCRGGDPPPTSRRRRSGRRNEAGWPWSYSEANGTTLISTQYNKNSIGQIFPMSTVPTVPGSKRALMSSKISATSMAKERLAWMWYLWLRMVLTELKSGMKSSMYHQHCAMKWGWGEDTHDKTAKVTRVMARQKMEMEQPT